MTAPDPGDQVFDLLPALYRERDARPDGQPGFLQGLLNVIAGQLAIVEADVDQLYDDLFIETCAAWVVPYIGDLVAVTPGAPDQSGAVLTRAAVADAIALRRRKGTAAVLEQLARDLTGWPAVAAEMFERMAVTQHMQHVVPTRVGTVPMRSALVLERVGTSFDGAAHTLEVRRIGSGRGKYDVQNVAVMVWRDIPLPRTWVDASGLDSRRFRFNPLGCDQALITQPQTEVTLVHQVSSLNVPGQVTRRAMAATPGAYYGAGLTAAVRLAGQADTVAMSEIVVCDLSDATPDGAAWANVSRLGPSQVAIDPQLGRLAFGTAQPFPPQVSFVVAAPSDLGGTELSDRPANPAGQPVVRVLRAGTGGALTSVAAGLAAAGGAGTVEIGDSRTYSGDLSATVPAETQLRLTSPRGAWPLIALDDGLTVSVGEGGVLTLTGLIIAGGPVVVRGRPDRVEITDCTLVPGQRIGADAGVAAPVGPSVVLDLDPDWPTEVIVTNCVTGPLLIPAGGTTLAITDSIVDSVSDGLGRSFARQAPARVVPVLRSPRAILALDLPPGATRLELTLGTDAPRIITLAAVPADLTAAAAALDAALVGTGARSFALDDRVVIAGDGRPLAVSATPGSGLADGLGLTGLEARAWAVIGSAADLTAASGGGSFSVTDHRGTSHPAALAAGAASLGALAGAVQAAVRAADPGLAATMVGVLDSALVVVSSATGAVTVTGAAPDLSTAWSLGLVSPRPAIAGDFSGTPCAPVSLTRCTVFGAVRAESVGTISDSIITGLLTSDRRQVGCAEYSWIKPGSQAPRQHQCQPATPSTPEPVFVSRQFGTPGYGRLRRAGATAVIRSASDGFEMGAMARLGQTQRDDNLRRGIAEFLRFGLEAGVADGT